MMMAAIKKMVTRSDEEGEDLKAIRHNVAHDNCSLCVRVLACPHDSDDAKNPGDAKDDKDPDDQSFVLSDDHNFITRS